MNLHEKWQSSEVGTIVYLESSNPVVGRNPHKQSASDLYFYVDLLRKYKKSEKQTKRIKAKENFFAIT